MEGKDLKMPLVLATCVASTFLLVSVHGVLVSCMLIINHAKVYLIYGGCSHACMQGAIYNSLYRCMHLYGMQDSLYTYYIYIYIYI